MLKENQGQILHGKSRKTRNASIKLDFSTILLHDEVWERFFSKESINNDLEIKLHDILDNFIFPHVHIEWQKQ